MSGWARAGLHSCVGAAVVESGDGTCGQTRPPSRRWLSGSVQAGAVAGGAKGIALSEAAARRLREVNSQRPQGDPEVFLRVTVDSGGCGGFQYAFSLDTTLAEGEKCFEHDGARVAVDQLTLEYMEGSVVDYEDTLMRAGFAVSSNPKASSKCGCGTSFTPVEL